MSRVQPMFTGVDDPLYKAWVKAHVKPGKRTPSPAQAEVLITMKEKNRKSSAEKEKTKKADIVRKVAKMSMEPAAAAKRQKIAETKAKNKAARTAKKISLPSVGEATVKVNDHSVVVVINNNTNPESTLDLLDQAIKNLSVKSFVFRRLFEDGIRGSEAQTARYTRQTLKNVVYGSRKVDYEVGDGTRYIFRTASGGATNFSLRDSINSNCVLEAVKKFYGREFNKKVEGVLLWFFHKYSLGSSGVTKEIMGEMAKKLRKRIIVRNAIDHVWYDSDPANKTRFKRIEFYALNNHASCYVPLSKFEETTVEYGDVDALTADIHQLKRYFVRVDEKDRCDIQAITPEAIWSGNVIYKSFRPSSVTGNEKDDSSRAYFLCTNEDQFRYKIWVEKNKLRPLSGVYFDIFRNADNYLTMQRFSTEESNHLYDMNRAYPSFKTNELYEKYKLIVGYVCLYDTSASNLSEVLDCAGVSYVSSIQWHNEFASSTGWVYPGQWYNHIILYTLVSMGWATITVSQSCICRQPEDLEFPFGSGKFYNNAFIGRLVCGASSVGRVEYTRVGLEDLSQVLFDYEVDPLCRGRTMVYDGYESKYVSATLDVASNRKQLHQIHGCIIAYQQVTMMKAMVLASSYTTVIAYNTDGFHVRDKFPMETSLDEGKFKYERKPIKYACGSEPMATKEFTCSWDNSILPLFRVELGVTLTTGPAGCGKSYTMIEKRPGVESVVVCPLNELVVNTRKKTEVKVSTYHKYFGIHSGGSYRKLDVNEVVIADEVSMIPGRDLLTILETCRERRVCLDLIGDVREKDGVWSTDQMKPVDIGSGKKASWDDAIRSCKFTHREIISDVRRQNADDGAFCDSLRGMKLSEMRERLVGRLGVNKWSDVIREDCIGLSSTHMHNHNYNSSIVARFRPRLVPGRCIKTIKKDGEIIEAKGAIKTLEIGSVWCDRQSVYDEAPKNCRYELAYFRTSNAVQGQSIGDPYVINIGNCNARFLYTAVSRCRSLNLITLVDSRIDWPIEDDE